MNANPKFLAATAQVDEAAIKPLPNSRKVYIEGSRPDIRVPMREISQSDTPASFGAEKNPPITVYEPRARIPIRWPASTFATACPPCAPDGSRSAQTPRSFPARVRVTGWRG